MNSTPAESAGTTKPDSRATSASTASDFVSIRVLRSLVRFLEQSGIPRADFLRAAQLEPERLESRDACVPLATMHRYCELALDLTHDPALGLHWAESMTDRTFAPLSHVIAHSESLRDALNSLTRFHRLLGQRPSFQLIEGERQLALRCLPITHGSARVQRFVAEATTLGFHKLLRRFGVASASLTTNFAYAAPAYRAEYSRAFQQSERFSTPFNEVVFSRALLDAPADEHDDDVRAALLAIAERRLSAVTQTMSYALRIRELLIRESAPHQTTMKRVAHTFGLNIRSLRRRLAQEGTSYGDVLDEVLAIVAKQLLSDRNKTIQEIASEMGFSDATSFHRAFKRWTATTPRAYRQAMA